jgi:hypothetical protein
MLKHNPANLLTNFVQTQKWVRADSTSNIFITVNSHLDVLSEHLFHSGGDRLGSALLLIVSEFYNQLIITHYINSYCKVH